MSESKLPEPKSLFYKALLYRLNLYEVSKRDLIVMLFNAYIDSDFSFQEVLRDLDIRYGDKGVDAAEDDNAEAEVEEEASS